MIFNDALTTERLVVRPFQPDDAPRLVGLFSDPRVHRYVDDGQPLAEEVASLWIQRSSENLRRFGYGTGAVVLHGSGELVGWAGFARPREDQEELIYGLAASCWGRGLGRELLAGLIGFAWRRGLPRIRATVDPENKASIHLLTRAGFELRQKGCNGEAGCDLYELQAPAAPASHMLGAG